MEKINQTDYPSEGVVVKQEIDIVDGKQLDTSVEINGNFVISGSQREAFLKKLGALIDEYRI